MNKKLARALRTKRMRERGKRERSLHRVEEFRRLAGRFKVEEVPGPQLVEFGKVLAGDYETVDCFACGKRMTKKSLKAGDFYAIAVNLSKKRYPCHREHFVENGATVADAAKTMTEVWNKAFRDEFKQFRDLIDGPGK